MATDDTESTTHDTALRRFGLIENKERDQRRFAVEDIKFAQTEDGQYDDHARKARKDRPRYTINRVAGAVDQLVGDQRQSRTDIKVRPVSGGSTEDIAKVMTGLIRNIESNSKAANAYDNGYDESVNGGYGGWRVITEFNDDDSFEQDIKVKQILGATTSLWFGPSQEYDKRDAPFAFYTVDMDKDEHKEKFKDSAVINWPQERFNHSSCRTWFNSDNNTVRVAEYWVKTPVNKEIGLLSDGRVIDIEDEKKVIDELAEQGITIVKKRTAKSHKVEMYLMDGGGILEGPKAWAGKFIPLIPVFGRQTHIEGVDYTRGIVRFAKDANRIYNYTTSAYVETTALSPKDPYWYIPGQEEGHEAKWESFNTRNDPFMPYNQVDGAQGPPTRTGPPAVQLAFAAQIQQASMDLYHTTNMQPPSLGANPELKSGKAIQAQERLGDRGNYIFSDNLEKSIDYTGEILIDLIPRIIDTDRQERILAQDGETELVSVNQVVRDDETGEDVIVNDLSLGKYDLVTETGPAFATQRQESAEQIIQLIGQSPTFEALAMDLVAKDLPILESKELTKRVRKLMISQGVVEPTEEETKELGLDQPQEPDPQQEAITTNINMQTEELISKIEERDAKTEKMILESQNSTISAFKELMEAFKTQMEAGIPFDISDHNNRVKQQDIVGDAQQVVDPGPNNEQIDDLVNNPNIAVVLPDVEQPDNARRLTVEQPSASIGQDVDQT